MWADLLRRPWHLAVLALCALLVLIGQWLRWDWFIDDAAICFAYARNIAAGEGIVPWPGAERIEGFSDPTWMGVLTLFQWVGLDGFTVAKPLALLFSWLCLPIVYRTAQLAMEDDAESDGQRIAPLFAPLVLAMNAQLAIWSASALENGLWCFLLALAIYVTVQDGRQGRFLRSAVCWLLITWSRPEGIAYALCGVFWWLVMLVRSGRDIRRPLIGWMTVFWTPTLVLELMRLWYFAWPLPNTWYAKVHTKSNFLLRWDERGWGQVREYADRLWHGWYLPAYVFGLLGIHVGGSRGDTFRARVAWTVVMAGALVLLYPAPEALRSLSFWPQLPPPTDDWVTARIVLLSATAVILPLFSVGGRGWDVRVLCWHCCTVAILFSVYANGDWMGAYRWMSLMAPAQAVLLACGLREVIDWIERQVSGSSWRWQSAGWLAASFGVLLMFAPNASQLRDHVLYNQNETPRMVKLRADYTSSVVRRTFYEGVVRNLEMDQGAHLWWHPEYVEIDMAGLVDIPMARHRYSQRVFIEDYVFDENPPTFGHVHYGWAKISGFKTYERWTEMVELPPYEDEAGLRPHDGVWARRTLFMQPRWDGPERRTLFEDGLVMLGFDTPGEIWGQDDKGFLEIGISSRDRDPGEDARFVAFLADGARVVASWELPLGYGLFPMDEWHEGEVFIGRYALMVHEEVVPGWYDLGFVAFSADGRVLGGTPPPGQGMDGRAPVMAQGEVLFPRAIKVTSRDDMVARAEAVKDQVLVDAESGHCEGAEQGWIRAKRVRPGARRWAANELPQIERALADCWARRAESDPTTAARALAQAHRWDHHSEELARVGGPVGDALWQQGKEARARGDWQTAYDSFAALLKFQPWRSWARLYAEEARDHRLGLADR
jgi:hypothetical protein